MSRDTQWGTVGYALRSSWRWPASDEEMTDLANRVARWSDLGHLVEAVEYYQRTSPDRRPAVNELAAEAARRQRLATADDGQPSPCPTCNSEGWLDGPDADGWPTLRPCPTCRPGTAEMHAKGRYAIDVNPHSDTYQASAERAKDANERAPKYGPTRHGPPTKRSTPTTPTNLQPKKATSR